MKKIGIVTYYGENYGGMLQAYALQRFLNEKGYECKLISNDFLYQKHQTSKYRRILQKLVVFIKNPIDYLERSKAMHLFSKEKSLRASRFKDFALKNLIIDHTGYTEYQQYLENPPEYDVYLCGSDQIWNPNLYNKNGFYFADFASKNSIVVSYASSIGVSSVTKEQADFMKPFLDKIDVISTREEDGSKIVENITHKKARTVLDPTLLLDGNQWLDVASKPIIDKPYIFCYLFGERDYIAKVKQQVKEITGFDIVSIPYVAREMASDDIKAFDVGPAEFISLIKNAELVLTDSFHATAFSINLKTPFISLCRFSKKDSKGMNSRLTTILETVDLTDRLFDENDRITKDILFSVDFEKAHTLLNERRKKDTEFLLRAIEYQR